MKRAVWSALLLTTLVALALGASTASAGDTMCTGALGAITIEGNVTAGSGCNLNGTTVNGNIKVVPGGSLFATSVTVRGNVRARNPDFVLISLSWVGGNVEIDGATNPHGFNSIVGATTVVGNVVMKNSTAVVGVSVSTIGGNVVMHDNTGSNSLGTGGGVSINESNVSGNVEIYRNELTGSAVNVVAVLFNNIGGNIHVHDNSVGSNETANEVTVQSNGAAGNVEVHDNVALGQGLAGLPPMRVRFNIVTSNLNCHDNSPPASAFSNVAKQLKGECAVP